MSQKIATINLNPNIGGQMAYPAINAYGNGDSPRDFQQTNEGISASVVRVCGSQRTNQISTINSPGAQIQPASIPTASLALNPTIPTPSPIIPTVASVQHVEDHLQQYHNELQQQGQQQLLEEQCLHEQQNHFIESQHHAPQQPTSLSSLMKGKSPKQFALMQVYGQPSVKPTFKAAPNPNKSMQSGSLSGHLFHEENSRTQQQLSSPLQTHSVESVGRYDSQHNDVAPSKYTVCSQALMKKLIDTGNIGKSEERIQSQPNRKMLLSDDEMHQLEKENKHKPVETNEELSKREKDMISRLFYDNSSNQEKEQIKKFYTEQEMKECTFSPRLCQSNFLSMQGQTQESVQYSKREPTFFEQSQKMLSLYEHHREVLKDAKDNEQKQEVQEKPKLSKKQKKIGNVALEKKGLKNVHVVDRLYMEKKEIEPQQDPYSHKPQISSLLHSKPRTQKVDDYLYQDAKRRRQEGKLAETQVSKDSQQSVTTPVSTHQKKKQQKAIASKFDKEFQNAVASMAFTKDPSRRNLPETISYLEAIEILQNLQFIGPQSHEENQQASTQVQRIWNQLSGNNDKPRVLVRNLEVFLFAVQNIRADQDMIPFVTSDQLQQESQPINQKSNQLNPDSSSPHSNINPNQKNEINPAGTASGAAPNKSLATDSKKLPIGTFDKNDNLSYTDEQVAIIHRIFKDVGDSRLASQNRTPQVRISRTAEAPPTFAPEISETSRRLAQEKRDRVVNDLKSNEGFDGTPLDMNEILIYQQQLTRYQNEEMKAKLEDEKMHECTFHPQTKDFSKVEKYFSPRNQQNNFEEEMQGRVGNDRKGATSTKPLGIHRTIELYSLAKPQNQRRDRNKGDIEYEKECDECTFAPDISHIKLVNFNASMSSQLQSVTSNPQNKSKLLPSQQKDIQKNIDRIKSARVTSKVSKSLSDSGTTISAKKRESIERLVNISLQNEKHTHIRPEGRFLSASPHSHGQGYPHQRKVVQSSPKPTLLPQEANEYNHSGEDSARNLKPSTDQPDVAEYFLKPPQGVEKEKPGIQGGNSKTMEEDRVPLLFVDVNIEDGKTARIIVYEGEKSEDLANKFAQEHNLDAVMTGRLKDLLDQQINSLLTKIDEEVGSDHEEEEGESGEDEQGNFHHRRHKKSRHTDGHGGIASSTGLASQPPRSNTDADKNFSTHQHEEDHEVSHSVYTEENIDYAPQTVPAVAQPSPSQQNQATMDPQEVMNMHMRALATTFMNFSENQDKQNTLPPSDGRGDNFALYKAPTPKSNPLLNPLTADTADTHQSGNFQVNSNTYNQTTQVVNNPYSSYSSSNPLPNTYGINSTNINTYGTSNSNLYGANPQSSYGSNPSSAYNYNPSTTYGNNNPGTSTSSNYVYGGVNSTNTYGQGATSLTSNTYGVNPINTYGTNTITDYGFSQVDQNNGFSIKPVTLNDQNSIQKPVTPTQSSSSYTASYTPSAYQDNKASNLTSFKTRSEIEEMQMRALAATYQNFSNDESKFNNPVN